MIVDMNGIEITLDSKLTNNYRDVYSVLSIDDFIVTLMNDSTNEVIVIDECILDCVWSVV